ncbi:hypothetical protein FACS1894155_00130 [Bacteroidia bacterium]|nr:hypothetical protein FACS189455_0280 [Bacteroidia bacterium]GHU87326.1 hypothetical protein FACS1894155_00130 [Bacteroidia bacterium]
MVCKIIGFLYIEMKRMKTSITELMICTTIIFLFSCSKKQETSANDKRIYFTIPEEDRKILIPVQLNDSVTVNLTFDTGWDQRCIELDSTIFALYPELIPKIIPDTLSAGVAWSNWRLQTLQYNTPISVKTGNTELRYDKVRVRDWKRYMGNDTSDGIFNIPRDDTVNVWELNFEHNYLEIHSVDNFRMPDDCSLFPFYPYLFGVQLPMKLQSSDGDTLTMNPDHYIIDTGMYWDIAVMYQTRELEFFSKKEDAVWIEYLARYYRHYSVEATVFDNFVIDSLRIYTFDYPMEIAGNGHLIGQEFLRHFNVFFDMKNKQLGLQPIKNYKRIVNPFARRFHYASPPDKNRKFIITKIKDDKDYFYLAGLREGDEIVAINGVLSKYFNSWKTREAIFSSDTLYYDIIRNGKPLKIIVPVDKTEERGD